MACAAAVASLDALERRDVPALAAASSAVARSLLAKHGFTTRGRGLMLGIELPCGGLKASEALLQRGFITLPAGPTSLGLTPPATVTPDQWEAFVAALVSVCT